jgi:hypothetical protein
MDNNTTIITAIQAAMAAAIAAGRCDLIQELVRVRAMVLK